MQKKGLTLVEMLVVLAIIGILLGVGGYSIVAQRARETWRNEVRALEGLLRSGSQIARATGRAVALNVSHEGVYLTQDGKPLHLDGGRIVAPHLHVHLSGQLQAGGRTSGILLTWRPSGRVEGERVIQLSRGERNDSFVISSWGELEVGR